jgi:predicted nucleic-acid-binding protein
LRAVDTNVLVRWITRDDPAQLDAADAVMSTPVLIPLTVLVELAWTLQGKTFRMTRAEFAEIAGRMLAIGNITIPSEDGVRWAIERFAAGADFANMIHIVAARGAVAFVSFESRLSKLAGTASPMPIERP